MLTLKSLMEVNHPRDLQPLFSDESHLSAHHYAKRRTLAIDAFTCGKTDPSVIIQYLHNELKKEYPDLIANMSHQMRRFGSIPEVGNIRPFVEKYLHS